MTHASALISRVLFVRSSGERMAAFRMAFGAYLLVYLGAMLPHVEVLFSDQGIYTPYLLPDFAPPPAVAWVAYLGMYGLAIALTLGFRTTLTSPLLLGLFLHHYFLQLAVKQSSFERLIIIYLVVFCLCDAGRVWGLDGRRAWPASPAYTAWGERLVIFQTVVLYLGAGIWKVFNPAWHGGELLRMTLQGMWSTPLGFALARSELSDAGWTAATRTIIAVELLLAPGLVWRRTRTTAMLVGTAFHLANCVILAIPEFLLSVTPYVVFMQPRTLRRVQAVVVSRLPRPLRPRASAS